MRDIEHALRNELTDQEYAEGYAESFLYSYIATQIQVLREQRQLSESELAQVAKLSRASIRRMEDVNNTAWSIPTLIRIARALDVRLKISFETFGSLASQAARFNRRQLERVPRQDDPGLRNKTLTKTYTERSAIYDALIVTEQPRTGGFTNYEEEQTANPGFWSRSSAWNLAHESEQSINVAASASALMVEDQRRDNASNSSSSR